MKQIVIAVAACALLFACTPGDKNSGESGGNQNNQDELTVTGTASDITEYSATLTGYANLPFELGYAEVGIMYDTKQSFEDGQKVAATALDGNNKFTVTVSGLAPGTTYYYKSYVQNGMAVKYGSVLSFTTKDLKVESISIEKTYLPLLEGSAESLSVTVTPDNAKDRTVTWTSSNDAVAYVDQSGMVTARKKGEATIKASANDGSRKSASCYVTVYRIDTPDAVDLGLIVNGKTVKWASFNLGASSPEEYGVYYAWGETEPKSIYDWASYKWCNGSSSTLTKYSAVDNKTEFKDYNYEDDAARQALGGKWRIPTDSEWTEIREKCTWTWTSQNGINGYKVTASNGNSIFLPAASHRINSYLSHTSSRGRYWSSSLAWGVYFDSDNVGRSRLDRCYGRSVRPVSEL